MQREVITAGPPAQEEGWRDGGGMEEAVEVEEKLLAERAERRCGGVEVPGLLYIPRMSLLFSFQRR